MSNIHSSIYTFIPSLDSPWIPTMCQPLWQIQRVEQWAHLAETLASWGVQQSRNVPSLTTTALTNHMQCLAEKEPGHLGSKLGMLNYERGMLEDLTLKFRRSSRTSQAKNEGRDFQTEGTACVKSLSRKDSVHWCLFTAPCEEGGDQWQKLLEKQGVPDHIGTLMGSDRIPRAVQWEAFEQKIHKQ